MGEGRPSRLFTATAEIPGALCAREAPAAAGNRHPQDNRAFGGAFQLRDGPSPRACYDLVVFNFGTINTRATFESCAFPARYRARLHQWQAHCGGTIPSIRFGRILRATLIEVVRISTLRFPSLRKCRRPSPFQKIPETVGSFACIISSTKMRNQGMRYSGPADLRECILSFIVLRKKSPD